MPFFIYRPFSADLHGAVGSNMLPMSLVFCKYLASKVLKLNPQVLAAGVVVLCVTGSYSYMNNPFHVGVMVVFGLIGYLFWKFGLPQAPLILSSILGGMMESNWVSSMVYANNSPVVFIQRPISLVLVILSALFLLWPLAQRLKTRLMNAKTVA